MDAVLTLPGIVATAAAVTALLALMVGLVLLRRVSRLRAAQEAVLGGHEQRDLVAHAERLERGFSELQEWMEEALARHGERLRVAEQRLDGAIAYHAVVRYDAMGEMSGHQSSTLALLDTNRSGVVVSSILHRDQARIYAKPVLEGRSQIELSPEEAEAVATALESGAVSRST